MSMKEVILLAFGVSLFLTVFGFGLRATRADILYVWQRPGLLTRSLLAMFFFVPVFTVALVNVFDVPNTTKVVLVALSISPIPPMLPRRLKESGAKGSYLLGLLVTVALLSIVIVPLLTELLGRYYHQDFSMPPSKVAAIIFRAVIIPMAAGIAVRRFFPGTADRIARPVAVASNLLLIAVALVALAASLQTLWALTGGGTVAVIAAFIGASLATGHLLGSPVIEHEGTLAVACAARHPGIALALAGANFPGEHFAGTILLYLLMNVILCIPYIKWQIARGKGTTAWMKSPA
jgi:bile acid:Na+ symporter, BASS family